MQICGYLRCRLTKTNPRRFRTATDGGDTKQEHVFCEKNVSLNNVHGRTLFNSLFAKALERKKISLIQGVIYD